MNVVVSAGGRFHALHLAAQLEQRHALQKLFTFSYGAADRDIIPARSVSNIDLCSFIDHAINRLHLRRFIAPSKLNTAKDILFDRLVSRQLAAMENIDIFTGWANYSLRSLQTARSKGAKIIIESGSSHIGYQQQLLEAEYRTWNIDYTPICQRNKERMLTEYQAADYIMTLSTFARNSFTTQGFAHSKILTVPCGTDVEYFLQKPQRHTDIFRVLFVGQLQLRKGIHYLLEAWHQLGLPQDRSELVIIGSSHKDFLQLQPRLPNNPNVRFVGGVTRAHLKQFYAQSSLFVLPSIEDGFGMVIGEAMASGVPVIASHNSGAPDIISHGTDGLLVAAGSAAALAQQISWIYQNRDAAHNMGMAGQKSIQQFTWERYGKQLFATYQQLV